MLYLTKHIVQWLVLAIAKQWFITTTKTKKWTESKWPKVHKFFKKKVKKNLDGAGSSFVRRAVMESRMKIKKVKENVKKQHGAVEEVKIPE